MMMYTKQVDSLFWLRLGMLCVAVVSLVIALLLGGETEAAESTKQAAFDKSGSLVRPTGYREWIFIGAPLTPNDMNNGKAAFPEFHNVYIDPESWAYWKNKGEFRDGTVVVKELVSVGSKTSFSGNGYFEGEYIGLEAMVKSKARFANNPGNWGFFRFTNEDYKSLKTKAQALPNDACSSCHAPNAKQDLVFIQHYPVLRAGKATGKAATGGY
jgi:hypothetical protein